MSTYLLFGKYSHDSIKKISAKRTNDAAALIKANGGELKAGYAMLGEHDLLLIVDFPATEQALKTAVALAKMLEISFSTSPAVDMEVFDKLIA
jgi:uncharacterized protein with GYD domain